MIHNRNGLLNHQAIRATNPGKNQSGVVLILSLIMLLLLTLIGTVGVQSTSLEEKMAHNARDKDLAFQTAESALTSIENNIPALANFSAAGTSGLYTFNTTVDLSDAQLKSDAFWINNPVASFTTSNLGNSIANAQYIIQALEPGCFIPPCTAGVTQQAYSITVRATGRNSTTVVVLQAVFTPT